MEPTIETKGPQAMEPEKKVRKPRKDKGVKRDSKKAAKKAAQAKQDGKLLNPDLGHYVRHEIKTPSGNKVLDIDDPVAVKLRGKSLDEVYAIVAVKCEVVESELRAKYKKLNPGMQRMNLGNKLRATLNK